MLQIVSWLLRRVPSENVPPVTASFKKSLFTSPIITALNAVLLVPVLASESINS